MRLSGLPDPSDPSRLLPAVEKPPSTSSSACGTDVRSRFVPSASRDASGAVLGEAWQPMERGGFVLPPTAKPLDGPRDRATSGASGAGLWLAAVSLPCSDQAAVAEAEAFIRHFVR